MGKFKQKMYRFLSGRYGYDTLGKTMLLGLVALLLANLIVGFFNDSPWVSFGFVVATWTLLIWMYARIMSRNIAKRRRENEVFCGFFKLMRNRFRDRKTHVYRKCKHCKVVLRLPRAKGKHTVCCPRCHKRFETRG